MGILVIARSINPRVDTKGDDQNAHVIICLSHLQNLLFKEFYEKIVDFSLEKENGAVKMT